MIVGRRRPLPSNVITGPTTTLTCPNGDVYLSTERNGFTLYLTMVGGATNTVLDDSGPFTALSASPSRDRVQLAWVTENWCAS